jgi:hypothetical protein
MTAPKITALRATPAMRVSAATSPQVPARFGNHGACLEARAVLWSISIDNFHRIANEPARA